MNEGLHSSSDNIKHLSYQSQTVASVSAQRIAASLNIKQPEGMECDTITGRSALQAHSHSVVCALLDWPEYYKKLYHWTLFLWGL